MGRRNKTVYRFIKTKYGCIYLPGHIVCRMKKEGKKYFFRTITNQEYPVEKTKKELTKTEQELFTREFNKSQKNVFYERLQFQKLIHPEEADLLNTLEYIPMTFEEIIKEIQNENNKRT